MCRILDGSTNEYLKKERAIEEFLKGVEPKYNASVSKLRDGKPDRESIHAIGGFVAYVSSCAPAAMRIHSEPLRKLVEAEGKLLDKQGVIPNAPASLGGKSLTELLDDREIRIAIDHKYPQALGIETITNRLSVFGNSQWEILKNFEPESPFFTSDYPIAIERSDDARVLNRIIPLTPELAIRIKPDIGLSGKPTDLSFSKFSSITRTLNRRAVLEVNRLIVRCAEDSVFYREQLDWIPKFVAKNRAYRIEGITNRVSQGTGVLLVSTQRVMPAKPDNN